MDILERIDRDLDGYTGTWSENLLADCRQEIELQRMGAANVADANKNLESQLTEARAIA